MGLRPPEYGLSVIRISGRTQQYFSHILGRFLPVKRYSLPVRWVQLRIGGHCRLIHCLNNRLVASRCCPRSGSNVSRVTSWPCSTR